MWKRANGSNIETLEILKKRIHEICRVLSHISNKRRGIRERNMLHMVHIFIISRVAYAVPYLVLKCFEKRKLESIINKMAMGLPEKTSDERFMALGVNNTLAEICKAQLTSQYVRLKGSRTGKAILRQIGFQTPTQESDPRMIKREIKEHLHIPSTPPRNMHPVHNAARCRARAMQLNDNLKGKEGEVYTDTAESVDGTTVVSVVTTPNGGVSNWEINQNTTRDIEEIAVALAIKTPGTRIIVTDSESAIRSFDKEIVSPRVHKILEISETQIGYLDHEP